MTKLDLDEDRLLLQGKLIVPGQGPFVDADRWGHAQFKTGFVDVAVPILGRMLRANRVLTKKCGHHGWLYVQWSSRYNSDFWRVDFHAPWPMGIHLNAFDKLKVDDVSIQIHPVGDRARNEYVWHESQPSWYKGGTHVTRMVNEFLPYLESKVKALEAEAQVVLDQEAEEQRQKALAHERAVRGWGPKG